MAIWRRLMQIHRLLNLQPLLEKKSYFLWGPRQTGKSWLIRHTLKEYPYYNLLDNSTFLRLSHSPQRLREEMRESTRIIVIDEIQKLPILLDEVQLMIESYGVHFLLTGSSGRKLKRSGANMLGGRARTQYMHPFSYSELKEHFILEDAINKGLLPSIYFSDDPAADLKSYVGTYLKEEIAAEGATRNIPAFSRFLEVAALCNGGIINYTKISNDAQVARTTIQEYFQILKDTFIAYEIKPWKKSLKRKVLSTSKFYFFDTGVVKTLQQRNQVMPGTTEFGELFETYIAHELKTFIDLYLDAELFYWRTATGIEVDFIIDDLLAVEVKATRTVSNKDLNGLRALREEGKIAHYILVCLEETPRTIDGIQLLPWKNFLEALWSRKFC
jgi:predicted AAA+ superfamily ATPase